MGYLEWLESPADAEIGSCGFDTDGAVLAEVKETILDTYAGSEMLADGEEDLVVATKIKTLHTLSAVERTVLHKIGGADADNSLATDGIVCIDTDERSDREDIAELDVVEETDGKLKIVDRHLRIDAAGIVDALSLDIAETELEAGAAVVKDIGIDSDRRGELGVDRNVVEAIDCGRGVDVNSELSVGADASHKGCCNGNNNLFHV